MNQSTFQFSVTLLVILFVFSLILLFPGLSGMSSITGAVIGPGSENIDIRFFLPSFMILAALIFVIARQQNQS